MEINGIPMIQRVWQQAIESNIGEVFVACSEIEVHDLIVNNGGKAIMTDPNLPSRGEVWICHNSFATIIYD